MNGMPITTSRKSAAKQAPAEKPVAKSAAKGAAKAAAKSAAKAGARKVAIPAKPKRAPRTTAARADGGRGDAAAKTAKVSTRLARGPEAGTLAVKAAAERFARAAAEKAAKVDAKPAEAGEPLAPKVTPPPRHPRPKLARWEPVALPPPRQGKPEDPRLAAAIAARERWHGRSGRPALKSGTQAVAFARERRLVQFLDPTPLPNLVDPIVGKACLPAEREEGPAAATFRAWRREIETANDLLELRLAFERPTLLQAELWPAIVSVVEPREQAARDGVLRLPREAEEALDLLDRKGSVPVERLRSHLGLEPDELADLRNLLESRLLVLARGEVDEDDGPITVLEPFGRWAARAVGSRRLEPTQAFTLLFAAAIRSAAVLWPEEIAALFPWSAAERDAAVAACVQAGAVVTYDEAGTVAYVASPVPR